jgi:hypothetical protein
VTRPWKQHVAPLIHVAGLPQDCTIEARYSEYADAIEVRAVEQVTGAKSVWSTLSVRDEKVEVSWHELWAQPVSPQRRAAGSSSVAGLRPSHRFRGPSNA